MDDVRVIGARRAYEFAPDDIRLSSLTLPSVIDTIRQAFQFQSATIGTPAISFGVVPPTMPPGLTFSLGRMGAPDGSGVLIRTLSFEPRRVVIDVAGPSSVIDTIYQAIRSSLADLKSGDGSSVLGEPIRTLDQSTITARLSFVPAEALPPGLRSVFQVAMGIDPTASTTAIVPTILVQAVPKGEEYPGVALNSTDAFQFDLRAGVAPDHRVYFSVAPLDTENHLRYLYDLEAAVTGARA